MKKFDVHVCLVSDQAIPNFVPVVDKEFRPKEVVLLVTDKMKAKAEILAKIMRERCAVGVRLLNVADAYDMTQVGEQVFALLCDEDKEQVALNVTGGTKLMAIAAYGMFKDAGYPSFYFTDNSNEIILLDSNERLPALQPPKIKIEDYLSLHGYPACDSLQKTVSHPQWLEFGEELVRFHMNFEDELGALNFEISKAVKENKQTLECAVPKGRNARNMGQLLCLLKSHDLAVQKNGKLKFADLDARQYVGGSWFEDYVFQTAKSLPGVQDIALNVQIENVDAKTHQNN